jgi:HD-like signal output (HDOD) protein
MDMLNAEELVAGQITLCTLPDVYLKVKAILNDPDSGIADVAEAIVYDPSLSTRFLRIANSALFGFPAKVRTVAHAVTLMGGQQVHDIVLATCVSRAFEGISNDLESMESFWQRSVFTAVLAQRLATRCRIPETERVFLQGLLREIGHPLMFHRAPDICQRALKAARERAEPVHLVEQDVFGFDHAAVGAVLCRRWYFPEDLVNVIACHVDPQRATVAPVECAVVHIAAVIADNGRELEPAEAWLSDDALATSGLDRDDILEALTQARGESADIEQVFISTREAA